MRRQRWRRISRPTPSSSACRTASTIAERIRLHVKNQVIPVLVYVGANIPAPGHVRHTGGGDLIIGQCRESRRPRCRPPPARRASWRCSPAPESAVKISGRYRCRSLDQAGDELRLQRDLARFAARPTAGWWRCPRCVASCARSSPKWCRWRGPRASACPATLPSPPSSSPTPCRRPCRRRPRTSPRAGRTEIDHLNGYVVRQGEALGIPTPVNRHAHRAGEARSSRRNKQQSRRR